MRAVSVKMQQTIINKKCLRYFILDVLLYFINEILWLPIFKYEKIIRNSSLDELRRKWSNIL